MSTRITNANLEAVVDRINRLTGSPAASYTRTEDGKLRANVGNYHLSHAYGGVTLHRMVNEVGGVTCPLGLGHMPKRELYDALHAFARGLEASGLSELIDKWEERARNALPADAMLINKMVREAREAMA